MAKRRLLDNVIIATKVLKGFKLKTISSIKPTMEIIKQCTGLDTIEEAMDLAACFDFSGGEIDNIVRKAAMEEVLSGSTPNMERIKTLCLQEKIAIPSRKIGF